MEGLVEGQESVLAESLKLKEQAKVISKAHKKQEVQLRKEDSTTLRLKLYSITRVHVCCLKSQLFPTACLFSSSEQTQAVRAGARES